MDASNIMMQIGASDNPSIKHIEPLALAPLVAMPNTPLPAAIVDYTGTIPEGTKGGARLMRQELYLPDIGTLPPSPSRFDGPSRRYESPEDMDDNYAPFMDKLRTQAEYDETEKDPVPLATNTPPPISQIPSDPNVFGDFVNETEVPNGVQLSQNYSLQQFLIASDRVKHVVAQQGLSVGQIVQNLQYLAVNVTEKVAAEYPQMMITSGYRYTSGVGVSNSKHFLGMAFDCQFPGSAPSDYYDIATRIAQILPSYDQILLEYKNYGTKNPWIHISYNSAGNRGMVLTLYNGKTYAQGLAKLV